MRKITIMNKAAITIHGLKAGGKLLIEADREGTPMDKHWRRRVADGKIDGAISIIKNKGVKK